MIVETLAILAVFVGGVALMRLVGLRGWPLIPVGFVAGTGLYLTVGLVQVTLPVTTSPVLTLAITAALPLAVWVVQLARGRDVRVSLLHGGVTLVGAVLAVMLFRVANLLVWHVDSLVYLEMGALLTWGHWETDPSNYLLTARLLGIPLIHAPANLTDDYYLRSAVPLLAAATVALLVWLFRSGTRGAVTRRTALLLIVAGVALLLTSNRVIYHFLYLNGHLMTGTFVLAIAGTAWLLATRPLAPKLPLVALQLVVLPALVITRPEGAVLAGIALLPMLLSSTVSARIRSAALAVLGASMVLWFGYVHALLASDGIESEWSTKGLLGVGVLLGFAAVAMRTVPLLRDGFDVGRSRVLLGAVEALLWLALVALTVRDLGITARSVRATVLNQAQGAWGVSIIALAGFVVLAMYVYRNSTLRYLRFPLTTFVPIAFLLAHLRDAAYRVGPTDSLNRMWIQVVPLAVLYVIAAVALDREDHDVDNDDSRPETALPQAR